MQGMKRAHCQGLGNGAPAVCLEDGVPVARDSLTTAPPEEDKRGARCNRLEEAHIREPCRWLEAIPLVQP
eukprot:9868391-Lingulodinium_polyedra.AAC.1